MAGLWSLVEPSVANTIFRQTQHPGYVETPGRKRKSRRPGVTAAKDEDSDGVSSAAGLSDDTIEVESIQSVQRRKDVKAANGELNGSANGGVADMRGQPSESWTGGKNAKTPESTTQPTLNLVAHGAFLQ